MNHFTYVDDRLFAEQVDVSALAERYGTPLYIYSRGVLEARWRAFEDALRGRDHLICYAVKANSNLAVLNVLAKLGSGFDIVSVGELERVLRAGGDPKKTVFSGVGKRVDEMRRALEVGIYCFNVESEPELERLNSIAGEMGMRAPASLRVNPDVDANTHPYISTGLKENKFGIEIDRALEVYARAADMPHIDVVGVDCHIGSQLTDTAPFVAALHRILKLVDGLAQRGIVLRHIDAGGGLGVRYREETPPTPQAYVTALLSALGGRDCKLMVEPGRSIVGNAGILVTRVEYLKATEYKNFAVVDAAMNDLIRPSLYSAWQDIVPVHKRKRPLRRYDVVGPVCETGDFLGKERELAIEAGDLLAIMSAGAYGFAMSSNYNTRVRAAEILVDGADHHVARRRETLDDLLAGEQCLPNV